MIRFIIFSSLAKRSIIISFTNSVYCGSLESAHTLSLRNTIVVINANWNGWLRARQCLKICSIRFNTAVHVTDTIILDRGDRSHSGTVAGCICWFDTRNLCRLEARILSWFDAWILCWSDSRKVCWLGRVLRRSLDNDSN